MSSGDFIKNYWEQQGRQLGASHEVSWGDLNMIRLEVDTVGKFIKPDDLVLDVGCANGFSTFQQVQRGVRTITGIDYASSMIANAEKVRKNHPLRDRIRFAIGDIRRLVFADDTFDVVYTTRVLINLPNWNDQMSGIDECLRVAKAGGTVVFSEAFWEPLSRLNALRMIAGLEPLSEPDFNRYLKAERLEQLLTSRGISFKVEDFSSVYYLGSRFMRELIREREQCEGFANPFNDRIFELETAYTIEGFGIQQAYVLRKPG